MRILWSLQFGVLSQPGTVSKTFTLHNINPVQVSAPCCNSPLNVMLLSSALIILDTYVQVVCTYPQLLELTIYDVHGTTL